MRGLTRRRPAAAARRCWLRPPATRWPRLSRASCHPVSSCWPSSSRLGWVAATPSRRGMARRWWRPTSSARVARCARPWRWVSPWRSPTRRASCVLGALVLVAGELFLPERTIGWLTSCRGRSWRCWAPPCSGGRSRRGEPVHATIIRTSIRIPTCHPRTLRTAIRIRRTAGVEHPQRGAAWHGRWPRAERLRPDRAAGSRHHRPAALRAGPDRRIRHRHGGCARRHGRGDHLGARMVAARVAGHEGMRRFGAAALPIAAGMLVLGIGLGIAITALDSWADGSRALTLAGLQGYHPPRPQGRLHTADTRVPA